MTAGQRRVKQKHGSSTDDSWTEKGQTKTRNVNRGEPGREEHNTERQPKEVGQVSADLGEIEAGQKRVKQTDTQNTHRAVACTQASRSAR